MIRFEISNSRFEFLNSKISWNFQKFFQNCMKIECRSSLYKFSGIRDILKKSRDSFVNWLGRTWQYSIHWNVFPAVSGSLIFLGNHNRIFFHFLNACFLDTSDFVTNDKRVMSSDSEWFKALCSIIIWLGNSDKLKTDL